ncbi:MAG: hypothetical protein AAGA96_12530 [Verrucomicrobiota bacterium]
MNSKKGNFLIFLAVGGCAFAVGWHLKSEIIANNDQAVTISPRQVPEIDALQSADDSAPEEEAQTLLYDPSLSPAQQILSRKQVRDLLTEFKAKPNRNDEQLILDRLLLGMTLENAAAIWQAFKTVDWPNRYQYFMQLGELGGLSVLEGFSTDLTSWQLSGVLGGWAKVDLDSAYTYWESVDPESKDYLELTKGLVYGWAALDPRAATEFVLELADKGQGDLWILLRQVTRQNRENSFIMEDRIAWAESITSPVLRPYANGDVMSTLVEMNPLVAAEWASQQDKIITNLGVNVVTQLGKYDPEAAISYARSHDPRERQNMLRAVADQLAKEDPEAAIAMVQTTTDYVEGDLNTYDQAFEVWGARDPVEAINWIEQNIPEDAYWEDVASAYYHTLLPWANESPVGVAEYLNTNASERSYGWGSAAMARSLKDSDPGSAIRWALLNPNSGWREELIVEAGKSYLRRDRDAALRDFANLNLDEEIVARLTDAAR